MMREIEKRKKIKRKKNCMRAAGLMKQTKKMLKMTIYSYADKKDMH